METTLLLAWSVNLLCGLGYIALGMVMTRRPQRLWAGMRVPRSPEDQTRMRRANLTFGPLLIFLGIVDVMSGFIAITLGMSALGLAGVGLGILCIGITTTILAALFSR
jgi:uncharacterized membrane protein